MRITVTIRMEQYQHKMVKEVAYIQGRSMSDVVGEAVAGYMVSDLDPVVYKLMKERVGDPPIE